jgi:gas vesicle protein
MSRGNASVTIFIFILGVSVGAVIALLLAPKAGEELRDDITTGLSVGVSHVRSAGKDLNRRGQKTVALAKDHVQDAIEAGNRAFSQSKKA